MGERPTYSIILPAYNEAANIERAIRETVAVFSVLGKPYEIVVVDDGSVDGTPEIAVTLSKNIPELKLFRHQGNCGKGTAVRTGVLNSSGELLLFLDCDLATHPSEAPAFIAQMGEYDIAIGSRRHSQSVIIKSQAWYRVVYGRLINFFVRLLTKLPQRDTQSGIKMFRAEVAKDIFQNIGPSRWTFDIELLLRARANGCTVIELPVAWSNGALSRVKFNEVVMDLWNLSKLKNKLDR